MPRPLEIGKALAISGAGLALPSAGMAAVEIARARELLRSGRAQEIRENAGLSRAEIAADLGVDQSAIWRWERGKRAPRGNVAKRYAQLLHQLEQLKS